MIFILFIYLSVLLVYRKSLSVVFLLLLQIISVISAMMIGLNVNLNDFKSWLWLMFIVIANLMTILPWKNAYKINSIIGIEDRVDRLFKLFSYVMPVVWVILLITYITVITLAGDFINEFKYSEGVSTEFYYTMLPIDVRLYMLATLLHQFSYFMFPFHFYYLHKRNYKKSLLALFYTTIILLYGATFFSRWTILHYFLIYASMFIILRRTFDHKILKIIKRLSFIIIGIAIVYFISISSARFEENDLYAKKISSESLVQDPTLYSLFDYTGQSVAYSVDVLNKYNGGTMKGDMAMQSLKPLMSIFGLISLDQNSFLQKKEFLMGEYWYKFTGLSAYIVFDFGIFIAFFFFLIYNRRIPMILNSTLSFNKLTQIMILIQLPLLSIFYSTLSTVLYLFVLYIPLYFYLYVKRVSPYGK